MNLKLFEAEGEKKVNFVQPLCITTHVLLACSAALMITNSMCSLVVLHQQHALLACAVASIASVACIIFVCCAAQQHQSHVLLACAAALIACAASVC
jgi:hypothetical protein